MPPGTALRNEAAHYLLQRVAVDLFLEVELLSLALATGIMDATTFPDYGIYASNQTGNTALLAVGALGIGGDIVKLKNIGMSLSCFVGGGIVFGQVGHAIGQRRRAWLLVSNWCQTALVCAAAAIRRFTPHSPTGPTALGIISLLAFASGGQVALARTIDVPEITTAMVTSAYIDIAVGLHPLQLNHRPRNRRIFFILNLVLGSFIGASAYRYVGPSFAFLLAAMVKFVVSTAFFFNRPVPEDSDELRNMTDHGN